MRFLLCLLLTAAACCAECVPSIAELGTIEGQFSRGECKGQDFLPDASTSEIRDLRPLTAAAYELTLPEGGGILVVRLNTPGLVPVAAVANEKLDLLQVAAGQQGAAAELAVSVKGGKHRIVVAAINANGGAYTLGVELQERRACPPPDLTFDQVLNGQLSADDCRLLDVQTPSSNLLPVDAYRIQVDSYSLFGIAAASNAFRPVLAVMNAKTGVVVHDGQNTNNGAQALLTLSLPEGEYLLIIFSRAVSPTGAYALRALREQPRACSPEPLTPPASMRSALTASDCRLLDFLPFSGNFSFIRPYTLELAEKTVVTLDQISTQFDSYLVLAREDRTVVAEDDDSGGNGNSRISVMLRPGKYTVLANAYDQGAIGAFELRAAAAAPRACEVSDLPLSNPVNATLLTSDCRLRDFIDEEPAENIAKAFRVTVETAGRLSVEISSSAFAGALLLLDGKGNVLPFELAQVRSGVIRGTGQVTAGEYTVLAYSFNGPLGAFAVAGSLGP
ncbi:MAG: hypothetical protein JNK48_12805 [Bryobacterales bacterium]|nr:hypothetical protein [Bryobacterales bacterium]